MTPKDWTHQKLLGSWEANLPIRIHQLRDWMKGNDCVVVAPGPSSKGGSQHPLPYAGWRTYKKHWTLACNRAVEYASPDFAVCMETRKQPIWESHILPNQPILTFTHITNPPPRCVQIHSDLSVWMKPYAPKNLRLGMSPFYAAAVACWLGFGRIGIIGVDLTPDRFTCETFLRKSEEAWTSLATVAKDMGSELVQLNPQSRLKAIPVGKWEDVRTK